MDNLDKYLRPQNTPASGTTGQFISALQYDNTYELNPYAEPHLISKGTVNTIAGGVLNLYDKTGGTKILSYDPVSGVVTILGSLVVQQSNSGTYTNVTLAGTNAITGTMQNGVYGTAFYKGGTLANATIGTPNLQNGTVGTTLLIGGTANADLYQVLGTSGVTGTAIYIKTVNFAGSTTTLGTVITKNGIVIAIN